MATVFTVRVDGKDSQQWSVDLGKDILEGKSDLMVRSMATDSATITLQGKVRKSCGNSAEAIETWLQSNGYPDAIVGEYTATDSKLALAKKLLAKLTPEQIAELLKS
jgi:hypothetical protein